ncbi:MAG TPA: hypothetical protein PLM34_04950 [Lentimicrobium sp.]|nr:hypothetical protein [Lentimicrobium sp.]
METIKITIKTLEHIISEAKRLKEYDSSLSDTIELKVFIKNDTHTGQDHFSASVICEYAECAGQTII